MSARALWILLAIVVCGTLGLIAQDSGAIRTTIVTTTPAVAKNGRIWSALVLATNADGPKSVPPELKEFAPKMKKIFGYNQFELKGSATQEIGDRKQSRLEPSKSFWIGLTGRRALSKEAQGGYLLDLQLFREEHSLLESEVKLAPGSPLFIRGPQYGKGQLIIVLQDER